MQLFIVAVIFTAFNICTSCVNLCQQMLFIWPFVKKIKGQNLTFLFLF